MRTTLRVLVSWPLLLASTAASSDLLNVERYPYVSPQPGSRMVSPWNNIVIRSGNAIDGKTLAPESLSIIGSASGVHAGTWVLSDDSKTMVFNPQEPFALGETVHVSLGSGPLTAGGRSLPPLSFSFTVSAVDPKSQPRREPDEAWVGTASSLPIMKAFSGAPLPSQRIATQPCDTLPADYPEITLITSNQPESGRVFMTPRFFRSQTGHLLILDNLAMPIFYRNTFSPVFDFKLQPNGLLTSFFSTLNSYLVFDSSYTQVDAWAAGNGYETDSHDLKLLPNGHALLMALDPQPVRMDTVVAGGNPNAIVRGLIIQELDPAKNVVFQWRSWDHFEITDMIEQGKSLTDSLIIYAHGNAIAPDLDGNLLLSSRHMNEITKIDRQTGDILWRLGLNARNNDFTFVNDPRGFSHQHDVQRQPNGTITLFDNGNYLSPEYSRAIEYQLDEQKMIATLVWEHRNPSDTFGPFMGNVQRRANGATMIGWGGTNPPPKLTDLHPDGSIAFELGFGLPFPGNFTYTYRAFRFPWETTLFETDVASLGFGAVTLGDVATLPLSIRNQAEHPVELTCFVTSDAAFSVTDGVPITVPVGEATTVDVHFSPVTLGEINGNLYVRAVKDTELVARVVSVSGTGEAVVANPRRFALHRSHPNPFTRATTIRYELPRESRVALEVFDVRGRKVDVLVDGVRPAGRHETTWRAPVQPSGLYFCRLRAGDFVATRKVAFLK